MPRIKTIQQAKRAYEKCKNESKNNPKKKFVIQEWEILAYPALQKIIDEKNANGLLAMMLDIPPYGDLRNMANAALENFGLSFISTPRQAKALCDRFVKEEADFDLSTIVEKWDQLSLTDLEKTNSIPMIKTVADDALFNSKAFLKAIEKWAKTCQTLDQIKELSDYVSAKKIATNHYLDYQVGESITKRTDEIFLDEIPKTNDVNKLKYYYYYASADSSAKLFAFERWLECCTTPQEADEAFKAANKISTSNITACQARAYERVKAFSQKHN